MKRIYRAVSAAFCLTVCAALSAGCSASGKYQTSFYDLFDTYSTITGYAAREDEFRPEAAAIYGRLSALARKFDTYNSYEGLNNLKTVNDNAGIAPVAVDDDIIGLVKFAIRAFDETGGTVNAALGPVLSIWQDYRERGLADPSDAVLPNADELAAAGLLADMRNVVPDEAAGTVFLRKAGMSLDVGALAKGYAVELVSREIREAGYSAYLLDIGGNVSAIGAPPGKGGWIVGVADPDNPSGIIGKQLAKDVSVVTSGDYQRFYMVGGEKYCHIIDPATLFPPRLFKAVTVAHEDSAVADMLSTALFVLPLEDGKALAERYGARAVWVKTDGERVEVGMEGYSR